MIEVADEQGKNKPVSKSTKKQIRQLQKRSQGHRALPSRIPLTDIPFRHFWAILKRDFIIWKRSWRRMAFEILFPTVIVVIMIAIRLSIPVNIEEYKRSLKWYSCSLEALSRPERMGLVTPSNRTETMINNPDITVRDYAMFLATFNNLQQEQHWLNFHNFTEMEKRMQNAYGKWLADNCQSTKYNKARTKIGIVGDMENSQMTREVAQDITDYLDIKSRFKNISHAWFDSWAETQEDAGVNPFFNLDGLMAHLDSDLVFFESEEKFLEHIQHD